MAPWLRTRRSPRDRVPDGNPPLPLRVSFGFLTLRPLHGRPHRSLRSEPQAWPCLSARACSPPWLLNATALRAPASFQRPRLPASPVASPPGAGTWCRAGTTLPGRTGVQGRAQHSMSQPLCCCNKDVSGWMAHKVECPQDRRAQTHSGATFKRAPAPFLRAQPLPGPHHLPDPPSRTIPGWRGGVRASAWI